MNEEEEKGEDSEGHEKENEIVTQELEIIKKGKRKRIDLKTKRRMKRKRKT